MPASASTHAPADVAQFTNLKYRAETRVRRRRPPSRHSPSLLPHPARTGAWRPRPSPSPHRAPPVASQLPRAFVAYSMRLCYPSTIIWIYCTYALLPTSSSRICGFAKSSTNINGLYCKVHRETISFVRSALEFVCLAVPPTCSAHGFVIIWCWWE